jgi:AbrB family looped-hinge helix DNA binding protein
MSLSITSNINRSTSITQKGQVTIPLEIRSRLGLKPKDKVVFELQGETAVLKLARSQLLSSYGAVKPISHPEDFQARREEFEKGVAEEASSEG